MDNFFIDALVRAGTYGEHAYRSVPRHLSNHQRFSRVKGRSNQKKLQSMRFFSSRPSLDAQSLPSSQELSRDDYKRMVDYYDGPNYEPGDNVSVQDGSELPDVAPEETKEDLPEPDFIPFQKTAWTEKSRVRDLLNNLDDTESSLEELFDFYKLLPFPGVIYLQRHYRNKLLHRLSVVEEKSKKAMLRYMSVVDDMKAAGIPLSLCQWSSAVHLVGRCHSIITAVEVESALHVWKEMEEEAGVRSSHVTFNILFDVAVKSGKFVLAKMILAEMKTRRLPVNRFAHVGMIFYHGLRRDGDGVRKAYRELVEAGEIVDTVVLNCVMASLIRAGELPAAEQVFQRMKILHGKRTGSKPPSISFGRFRELRRILDEAAVRYKKDPEKRKEFQREQSLSPDNRTFVIFLEHHVSETGNIQRVADLLDEMQVLGLPLHERLFRQLFKGFSIHGGVRYTSWTPIRLESVWSSYLEVLENDAEGAFVGERIAIWVVRAFVRCRGKKRSVEVWDELRSRWKASEQEISMIHSILARHGTP